MATFILRKPLSTRLKEQQIVWASSSTGWKTLCDLLLTMFPLEAELSLSLTRITTCHMVATFWKKPRASIYF